MFLPARVMKPIFERGVHAALMRVCEDRCCDARQNCRVIAVLRVRRVAHLRDLVAHGAFALRAEMPGNVADVRVVMVSHRFREVFSLPAERMGAPRGSVLVPY